MSSRSTSNWYPSAMTFIRGGVKEAANTERAPLSHQRQPLKTIFLFPAGRGREPAIMSTVTLIWSSSCLLQWGRNFSLLYLPVCLDTVSRLKQEEDDWLCKQQSGNSWVTQNLKGFAFSLVDKVSGLRVPCDQQHQNQLDGQKLRHQIRPVLLLLGISLALTYGTGAVKLLLLHGNFGSFHRWRKKQYEPQDNSGSSHESCSPFSIYVVLDRLGLMTCCDLSFCKCMQANL